MKYIHSLWSRDLDNIDYIINNFNNYLLSALLVKKHGHNIELYCDEKSYNFYSLIPYDKINVINYNDDNISNNYWVWGKIKPQLLINEPYVHIDGDVFLFKDVIDKNKFNNSDLVIQSIENEKTVGDGYNRFYLEPDNPFVKYKEHRIDWDKYSKIAYNCGVIGFNNIDFKNKYCNKVRDLLKSLTNDVNFSYNHTHGCVHILSEQSLLYYMAMEENMKPMILIPHNENKKNDYVWESKIPKKIGYCHMWSDTKYNPIVKEKIKNKIINLFPEHKYILKEFEKRL